MNTSAEITSSQSSASPFRWVFAAAVLVLLAAAGYLLRENMVMRNQLAQIQKERDHLQQREQDLQQKVSNQESVDAERRNELSRVREKLSQVQKQLASQASLEFDPRNVNIVALNLSAQTRNIGKTQILSLPAQVGYVAITLQLESTDFSEYQVALKDLDEGKTLWQSSKLAPIGKTIQFGMPVKMLKEENYIFELSGFSGANTSKVISGYPFRVVM